MTLGIDSGKCGSECRILPLEHGRCISLEGVAAGFQLGEGSGCCYSDFRFDGITEVLSVGFAEHVGDGVVHCLLNLCVTGVDRCSGLGDEVGVVVSPVEIYGVGPISELRLESFIHVLG